MKKVFHAVSVGLLCVTMSGCLGTTVRSGAPPAGKSEMRMSVTLLWGLKQSHVDATQCRDGISKLVTVWPIWGGVVAWFSFLLVVPTYTIFECAE
jgi:hypothetical protein